VILPGRVAVVRSCVFMRSRSGWRATAMNKGSIEGVRGTRIER
jgi:hypothetical protein